MEHSESNAGIPRRIHRVLWRHWEAESIFTYFYLHLYFYSKLNSLHSAELNKIREISPLFQRRRRLVLGMKVCRVCGRVRCSTVFMHWKQLRQSARDEKLSFQLLPSKPLVCVHWSDSSEISMKVQVESKAMKHSTFVTTHLHYKLGFLKRQGKTRAARQSCTSWGCLSITL